MNPLAALGLSRARAAGCLLAALVLGPPSAAPAQQNNQNEEAIVAFNTAVEFYTAGDWQPAIAKWREVIQKYPGYGKIDQAHYFVGVSLMRLKKHDEAAASFRTVLSKYKKSQHLDGAQYNLAMSLYQKAAASKKADDFRAAAAQFALVPQNHPQSKRADEALYYQAESLYSARDVAGAAAAYQKLIDGYKQSPRLSTAYYALGVAQQDLKRPADAAKTFQAFLDNKDFAGHRLRDEVRLRLAMTHFDEKRYAEAETLFGQVATLALDKFQHADFALMRQAQCLLELDKLPEAAKLFGDLPQRFPKSLYLDESRLAAGKVCFQAGKFNEAIASLQSAAKTEGPQAAEASYFLALALLKTNKPADALKLLDPAVQKFQQGEFAPYLQLARIDALYELPNRRQETGQLYANFAQQHADHALTPQALYMAALTALGEGDFSAARGHAESMLAGAQYAKHPRRPAVLYIAGESHLQAAQRGQQGADLAKAEGYYRRLVAEIPQHDRAARAQLRIGWCLHQAKKYDEAVAHLTSAVAKLKRPEQRAEAQLLIGQSHAAANRHPQAARAYEAALSAKGDWQRADEVLIALAQSQRALDKPADAAQRLEELMQRFSTSSFREHAVYQLGEIAQAAGKHDEAIGRYAAVLQQFPQGEFAAAAAYGQGTSHYAKGDFSAAVTSLTALVTTYGQAKVAPRGFYWRGLAHQRLEQYGEAVQDLTAYLAGKPDQDDVTDARYALALCQMGLEKYQPAADLLGKIAADKPDYQQAADVYYNLGRSLDKLDKPAEAAAAYRTLAAKWPTSPLAAWGWLNVGRHHDALAEKAEAAEVQSAELTKAAAAFAEGLKSAQDKDVRERLHYSYGFALFKQQKYEGAAKTLAEQLSAVPGGELAGPARFLAAECLFHQDKFTEALPMFAQVAKDQVKPYHEQSLYRAGTCANNLRQWAVAGRHLKVLVDGFPKFDQLDDARYGLALALFKQSKPAEARAECAKIKGPGIATAKARFLLGEMALAEKKYPEAIEFYFQVASSSADKSLRAESRYKAALCYHARGNKAAAIKQLERVVADHADHPRAKDAAKLIADLKQNP